MTVGTDALAQAFRLWVTDNVPASGANWPNKAEIIAAIKRISIDIAAASIGDLGEAVALLQPLVDEANAAADEAEAAAAILDEVNTTLGGAFVRSSRTSGEFTLVVGSNGRQVMTQDDAGDVRIYGLVSAGGGSSYAEDWYAEPGLSLSSLAAITVGLVYGQSNAEAIAAGGAALTTTQPYLNITFNGGVNGELSEGDLASFKPLVEGDLNKHGAAVETMCSTFGNEITRRVLKTTLAGPGNVVMGVSDAGFAGMAIDSLKPGASGTYWGLVTNQLDAWGSISAAQSKTWSLRIMPWVHMEADVGTNAKTWAAYETDLRLIRSTAETYAQGKGAQPASLKMGIVQTSWGSKLLSSNVNRGNYQVNALAMCENDPNFYIVTPTYHFAYNSSDQIHYLNYEQVRLGAYQARAAVQALAGRRPKFLKPVKAYVSGGRLYVRFLVPTRPLVLDTTALAATAQMGFAVQDATGLVTLSDFQVTSAGNEVSCALGRALGSSPEVRYALDALGTGLIVGNGASGNLRDSTTDTITVPTLGTVLPLWHVAPHFRMPITGA